MQHPVNIFIWSLFVSGACAFALGAYILRRGTAAGSRELACLTALSAIWCIAFAGEILAPSLTGKLNWLRLQYVGITGAPATWLLFAWRYATWGQRPTRRQTLALLAIPAISLLLAWTNPLHGLMRRQVGLVAVGDWYVIDKHYGAWFPVHIVYSYLAMLAGSVVLLRALPKDVPTYRSQFALVLAAIALPWLGDAFYLFAPSELTQLSYSSHLTVISSLLLARALYRFGLLDIVPAAWSHVIEQMPTGVLVADACERVVDMNPAASDLLGIPRNLVLRRTLQQVLYAGAERVPEPHGAGGAEGEVWLHLAEQGVFLEVRRSPLHEPTGRVMGQVLILYDVTERQRATAEREAMVASLKNALAQVRTLSGLLPICAHCKRIRDDEGYWTRLEEYLARHSEAEFTHGICPECLSQVYPELSDAT